MEPGERIKYSFGTRLRSIRKRMGLSADELAGILGVHRNTIYQLERGQQWIGADLLERIQAVLRLDISRLFSDKPPEATPEEALQIIARALKTHSETKAKD
jgi:transcriptional regulator with XRE-family HTH domain